MPKDKPKTVSTVRDGGIHSGWGGDQEQVKLPSGQKLAFEDDDDCILVFLGQKDISDRVPEATGPVIYLVFFDGKRVVNVSMSFALSDFDFVQNKFYYLHLDSSIPTKRGLNSMKDFYIKGLGMEGDKVAVNEDRCGVRELVLTLPAIADLNYTRLNYPLRRKAEAKKAK